MVEWFPWGGRVEREKEEDREKRRIRRERKEDTQRGRERRDEGTCFFRWGGCVSTEKKRIRDREGRWNRSASYLHRILY